MTHRYYISVLQPSPLARLQHFAIDVRPLAAAGIADGQVSPLVVRKVGMAPVQIGITGRQLKIDVRVGLEASEGALASLR